MDLNLKDVKALIKMFDESESDYLSFSKGDFKIKLCKNSGAMFSCSSLCESEFSGVKPGGVKAESKRGMAEGQMSAFREIRENIAESSKDIASSANTASGVYEVKLPIVGVFYVAKEPGAAPFVKEGDMVEKGQVLCILESMKMLNEVKAPHAGRVVKICAVNETLVEFGRVLFLIEE